jgi:hypothetical protein
MLALVEVAGAETEPAWHTGDIPAEHAIRGVHGVTLLLEDASPTAAVLTDVLGFNKVGQPDALQKAKKWATLVEVADSSSLNYRGAAVSAKHPGCRSGRVVVAISQTEDRSRGVSYGASQTDSYRQACHGALPP